MWRYVGKVRECKITHPKQCHFGSSVFSFPALIASMTWNLGKSLIRTLPSHTQQWNTGRNVWLRNHRYARLFNSHFPSNVPLSYSPSHGITREPLIEGIGLETPLGIFECHHTAFLSHPIPTEPLWVAIWSVSVWSVLSQGFCLKYCTPQEFPCPWTWQLL